MLRNVTLLFLMLVSLPLLAACTWTVRAPILYQEAEAIYQSLVLQDIIKDIWLEGAKRAQTHKLSGGDALGMMLLTAGLLQQSANLLDGDFHESLLNEVTLAEIQGASLVTVSKQWFDTRELSIDEVPAALYAIDTKSTLVHYANYLKTLGFSVDDLNRMETNLKQKLKELVEMPPQAKVP